MGQYNLKLHYLELFNDSLRVVIKIIILNFYTCWENHKIVELFFFKGAVQFNILYNLINP